jgi:streptogramin lyase
MKISFTSLILLSIIFCQTNIYAQIAIGQWQDHLPYSRTISVADAGDKVYAATGFSLFYYDKNDNSINRLSKVNGLSDVGINSIAYSFEYDALVIAYTNTNIDLLKDGEIINISDIKRKQILGNKIINNIRLVDSLAYLACGFGIVALDIKNEVFPFPTYFIGDNGGQVNVLDITISPDSMYAATEAGIYGASLDSPNLADFNYWNVDERLYPEEVFNTIQYFHNRLIVNKFSEEFKSDTLFYYDFDTRQWEFLQEVDYFSKYHIKDIQDQLIIVGYGNVIYFDASFNKRKVIYQLNGGSVSPRDATIDSEGTNWISDNSRGLLMTINGWTGEFINPNGPFSVNIFEMSLQNSELWVASGGRTSTWGKRNIKDGIYSFKDYGWNSYNRNTGVTAFDSITDVVTILVDKNTPGHVFAGTWMAGVMEFLNGEVVNIYDHTNSTLELWPAGNYVAVSGLDFDKNHNLWVVNSGAENLLSVRKTDGEWRSFSLGTSLSGIDAGKVFVDDFNQKWITVRAENQLIAFTDNGTIDNSADDRTKILTNVAGNGNLPGNKILAVAQDMDGEIWLGSDQGIGVIYSPGNVFSGGNFDAQRILVEVDGYVQYLLESETVTTITIDGDNRKWIGTERAGVFLVSEDGTEEIHHFTEENSPLFSNTIIDIEIDGKTGEVFFGTDKGIISYKSTATEGKPTNNDVLVYPNPVRPGYEGVIAIRGLVSNADVKITDAAGTLIYATRAEGGQATWSGHSFDGRKASSGVYLVFATDDQGQEKIVTKILFIN